MNPETVHQNQDNFTHGQVPFAQKIPNLNVNPQEFLHQSQFERPFTNMGQNEFQRNFIPNRSEYTPQYSYEYPNSLSLEKLLSGNQMPLGG